MRCQRSAPVTNIPNLWFLFHSPYISCVLKIIFVFCFFDPRIILTWHCFLSTSTLTWSRVGVRWVVTWVFNSRISVKLKWTSRQFIRGLTHRQFGVPISLRVVGTPCTEEPQSFMPRGEKMKKKMLLYNMNIQLSACKCRIFQSIAFFISHVLMKHYASFFYLQLFVLNITQTYFVFLLFMCCHFNTVLQLHLRSIFIILWQYMVVKCNSLLVVSLRGRRA